MMLQCVAVCCSVLQCVAVCCSVLQCQSTFAAYHLYCSIFFEQIALPAKLLYYFLYRNKSNINECSMFQYVAVPCNRLQCIHITSWLQICTIKFWWFWLSIILRHFYLSLLLVSVLYYLWACCSVLHCMCVALYVCCTVCVLHCICVAQYCSTPVNAHQLHTMRVVVRWSTLQYVAVCCSALVMMIAFIITLGKRM